jgi:hypothetical protein
VEQSCLRSSPQKSPIREESAAYGGLSSSANAHGRQMVAELKFSFHNPADTHTAAHHQVTVRAWTAGAVIAAATLMVAATSIGQVGAVGTPTILAAAIPGSSPAVGRPMVANLTPVEFGRTPAIPAPGGASIRAASGASAEGTPAARSRAQSVAPPAADLKFAGYTWAVKSSTTPIGPGPNLFDPNGPYVDSSGYMHLRILKTALGWESSEVILKPSLGYGTYHWSVIGPVAVLNPSVVLALFTYDSTNPTPWNREIDFEASRFSIPGNPTNAQYVVQPYTTPGNLKRILIPKGGVTEVTLRWTPGRVAYFGDAGPSGQLASFQPWTNISSSVPTHGAEQVHMSLWLFQGAAPTKGQPVSVRVSSFTFTPAT